MDSTFIIIVTYNSIPWINKCLSSCGTYTVVVVDNASSDTTLAFIKDNYPNVTLLKQTTNLGFGQANNIGIAYALKQGAEHVFLLNQDAFLVDDALKQLVKFQKQNPSYGILSPMHFKPDLEVLDEKFENYLRKDSDGVFNERPVLKQELCSLYNMRFVNAAAWLISKSCLEIVGGFDPIFFHYGEDENYCQRVIYHGFKIGVLSHSKIIHDRNYSDEPLNYSIYSDEYFGLKERFYKVKFGNVNNIEGVEEMKKQINMLKWQFFKALLKLNLNLFKNIFEEYKLLKRIKNSIIESRLINKKVEVNYY